MREITDLTVFNWNPAPELLRYREMEYLHTPSRRSYCLREPLVTPGVDSMLFTSCICEVSLLPGAHYWRRNAPFLSLEYIKEGRLLVRQRKKGYEMGAGEVFLMLPKIANEFMTGTDECTKISVAVEGKLLHKFLQESSLANSNVLPVLDRHHLERMLRALCDFADSPHNYGIGHNSRLTFELMQGLMRTKETTDVPQVFELLKNELVAHPQRDWSQQEMARFCGCSAVHLTRLFRKHYHATPHQMLINVRMAHAKQLLARSDRLIKEIAAMAGYANALNFSTEFRRRFGVSPREYRIRLPLLT